MNLQTKIQARINTLLNNITQDFDLTKLSKSPARFSRQKLEWFNKEYLRLISLSEFALRASQYKLLNWSKVQAKQKELNYRDLNFRIGGYLMIADPKKQKVLANKEKTLAGQDGEFYYVGGGKNKNENLLECLLREVSEEIPKKISLDKNKIKKIATFRLLSKQPFIIDNQQFDGKEMHMYYYELSEEEVAPFVLQEKNKNWNFDWHPLPEVIETNEYLTYPIWKNFCLQNDLDLFEPTESILLFYLSLLLDKNRIATLSELGTDSECITKWQRPIDDDLKWKKNTLTESKQNLQEIWENVILNLYNKEDQLAEKYLLKITRKLVSANQGSEINSTNINLPEIFEGITKNWESKIKIWLKDNNKSAGDYLWPLRIALSGKKKSPSPFELLAILPKEEANRRVKKCLYPCR